MSNPRRRWLWAVMAGIAVLTALYAVADPTASYMPRCVFRTLTGWSCPGCGSQRFLHALLTGHPLQAVGYNYFLPLGFAMIGVVCWLEATRTRQPGRYRRWMRPRNLYLVLAVIVAWWLLRNLLKI